VGARASLPTVIDLFAGVGGGSLGFIAAGFRVAAAVEIDDNAARSYALNVGVQPVTRDIRLVTGVELLKPSLKPGDCTVLFGCPPCQSFTILRRGAKVSAADRRRNALPQEYLRLVSELRPRHIAFENVPGMAERRGAYRFAELVEGLKGLGYGVVWSIVDAADFGVPQHRRRLLVIGSRVTSPKIPDATHSSDPRSALHRHVTVRAAIGGLRSLKAGEVDRLDPYHRARSHSAMALKRLRAIPEGGARADLPENLQLECHKGHDGHYDVYGRMWWNRPARGDAAPNISARSVPHRDEGRDGPTTGKRRAAAPGSTCRPLYPETRTEGRPLRRLVSAAPSVQERR
jgi:DNA (cytosine-5)-methyltransferase 1